MDTLESIREALPGYARDLAAEPRLGAHSRRCPGT